MLQLKPNAMKKIFLFSLVLICYQLLIAQPPQGFSYQAIVRNSSGEIVPSQLVNFRLSLINGVNSTVYFVETHLTTTTPQGIANLIIGEGSVVSGTFSSTPFNTVSINLKVEVDITGGTTFANMGTVSLKSVPYALSANTVNISGTTGQTLTHNGITWTSSSNLFNNGTNVGVGTSTPTAKFTITGSLSNPTIPSTVSSGILRIGNQNYTAEGIDIGHSPASPFSGWLQVGYSGGAEPFSLQPLGGNVGIGTLNPTEKLDINGQIRIQGGNPGAGKVLTSDATGVASWATLSGGSNWTVSGANIYRPTGNVGVGTAAPLSLLEIQGGDATDEKPIFAVRNTLGDVVFAVYQSGVRMYVDESTSKNARGGFAIGGIGDNLKLGNTYFQVTPDSVRVNLREPVAKGNRGGFAIGGIGDNLKEPPTSLMHLTPDNYFIGHRAGEAMETGLYNTFIGYEAGIKSYFGNGNIFLGFNTGHENQVGALNVFIGNEAGYNFTGQDDGEENVFIGNTAGRNITSVANSIFIGTRAGFMAGVGTYSNTFVGDRAGANGAMGSHNTLIGASAGFHSTGEYNTYLGSYAGQASYTGSYNVFIGYNAGTSETGSNKLYIANNGTSPLIYGDFASPKVAINSTNPTQTLDVNGGTRVRTLTGTGNRAVYTDPTGVLTTSTSDIRLKENVKPLLNSLSKVTELQGVMYNWKSDSAHTNFVGFIAQEVEEVIPELVFTNPTDGYKGVNYAEMTAILVEAMKEQQKQIEALKAELEELKAIITK